MLGDGSGRNPRGKIIDFFFCICNVPICSVPIHIKRDRLFKRIEKEALSTFIFFRYLFLPSYIYTSVKERSSTQPSEFNYFSTSFLKDSKGTLFNTYIHIIPERRATPKTTPYPSSKHKQKKKKCKLTASPPAPAFQAAALLLPPAPYPHSSRSSLPNSRLYFAC